MRVVQGLLTLARQPRVDDSDQIFIPLRVDDDHEPAIDGADRDEAVFHIRMLSVEDLESRVPCLIPKATAPDSGMNASVCQRLC